MRSRLDGNAAARGPGPLLSTDDKLVTEPTLGDRRQLDIHWMFPNLGVMFSGEVPLQTRARLVRFGRWLASRLEPLAADLEMSSSSPFSEQLLDLMAEWRALIEVNEAHIRPWLTLAEVDAIQADLVARTTRFLAGMEHFPLRIVDPALGHRVGIQHVMDLSTYATAVETVMTPVAEEMGFRHCACPPPEVCRAAAWSVVRDSWLNLAAVLVGRGETWGWDQPVSHGEAADVLDALAKVDSLFEEEE